MPTFKYTALDVHAKLWPLCSKSLTRFPELPHLWGCVLSYQSFAEYYVSATLMTSFHLALTPSQSYFTNFQKSLIHFILFFFFFFSLYAYPRNVRVEVWGWQGSVVYNGLRMVYFTHAYFFRRIFKTPDISLVLIVRSCIDFPFKIYDFFFSHHRNFKLKIKKLSQTVLKNPKIIKNVPPAAWSTGWNHLAKLSWVV